MSKLPPIQRRFELAINPVNPDATDVYMYGWVTDEKWYDDEECIATKEVREQLLAIKTGVINLHINSYGGSAFDGIAIHNLLKQHSATVNVYVDGIAASAASVIAMAGDKIFMPANTMLMIHRASSWARGNADELRKEAEALDKLDISVQASYRGRFIGTDEELHTLLSVDTYLPAAEAKALGFCDEILEDPPKEPPAPPEASAKPPKNAILNKYGFQNTLSDPPEKPQPHLRISKYMEAFFNGLDN